MKVKRAVSGGGPDTMLADKKSIYQDVMATCGRDATSTVRHTLAHPALLASHEHSHSRV